MGRERGSSGKALNTITLPAQTRPDVTVMADKALKTNFLPFPHNTHSYTITHFGGKSGPTYTYIPTYTKICQSQEARLVWMDLNKMSHRHKSITCHVQHVTTQVVYTHLLRTMARAWVMAISVFQLVFFFIVLFITHQLTSVVVFKKSMTCSFWIFLLIHTKLTVY